jgi:hypothetical protein
VQSNFNSYEVEEEREAEQEVSIEVVLGEADVEVPNDLVFEQTEDGAYIIDEASLHKIAYQHKKNKESISKKSLSDEEDATEGSEPTEHSDTSAGDDKDHDGDGVFGLRRQRRLYAQVAAPAPSSPTITESSHNSSNDMEVDSSSSTVEHECSHGRLGRTLSIVSSRATESESTVAQWNIRGGRRMQRYHLR